MVNRALTIRAQTWGSVNPARPESPAQMDFLEVLRMFAALGVTLGLIGLAAWGARRYGPATLLRMQTPLAERRLKIVETLVLDPSRRLVLVRVDNQERLLLLGEGRVVSGPASASEAAS
jgi:flagellar protein FliO/FliZ